LESARRRVAEESARRLEEQLDELLRQESAWRRWLARRWFDAARQACVSRVAEVQDPMFASLLEGYRLILGRLERTMASEGIERIRCVGCPFDPNTMTVLDLVDDPVLPPGQVVEEVRAGYVWKGAVLRFAEVRVVADRSLGGLDGNDSGN
jgi:molecular chaperone GrpE